MGNKESKNKTYVRNNPYVAKTPVVLDVNTIENPRYPGHQNRREPQADVLNKPYVSSSPDVPDNYAVVNPRYKNGQDSEHRTEILNRHNVRGLSDVQDDNTIIGNAEYDTIKNSEYREERKPIEEEEENPYVTGLTGTIQRDYEPKYEETNSVQEPYVMKNHWKKIIAVLLLVIMTLVVCLVILLVPPKSSTLDKGITVSPTTTNLAASTTRVTTKTASTAVPFEDNCDHQFNNHCYTRIDAGLTFAEGQQACERICSNLVSIHSDEENRYVVSMFNIVGYIMLGGVTPMEEYVMWIDGSPKDYYYTNSTFNTMENCLHMDYQSGYWFSVSCDRAAWVVCKRKMGISC